MRNQSLSELFIFNSFIVYFSLGRRQIATYESRIVYVFLSIHF